MVVEDESIAACAQQRRQQKMKTTNDHCVGKGEIIRDLVKGKRMKANKDDCTYIKE